MTSSFTTLRSPALFLGLTILLAGCAATPPLVQPPPDHYDEAWYQSAPAGQSYRIDPGASRIQITVRRAGWLKFLGHNHVIVNAAVEGRAWIDAAHGAGRADVRIDVQEFVVDPEQLRLEYGPRFGPQPSAAAVAATQRNLLGPRVLDAANYPYLTGRAELIERIDAGSARLAVSLVVKSHLWQGEVEAELRETPYCLSLLAELALDQRDLGLRPIGVYAGAISVAQRLVIRLELTARPIPGGDPDEPAETPGQIAGHSNPANLNPLM